MGRPKHIPASIIQRLGTVPDADLAREAGVSAETIRRRRMHYSIPAYRPEQNWTKADDEVIKELSIPEAAEELGVSGTAIKVRRHRLAQLGHAPAEGWPEGRSPGSPMTPDKQAKATAGTKRRWAAETEGASEWVTGLRAWLEQQGMTATDLAKAAGMHPQALCRILRTDTAKRSTRAKIDAAREQITAAP